MTPEQFKAIRQGAGLTQSGLADVLRMSDRRTIRHWEAGTRKISGPVSILMQMLSRDELPKRFIDAPSP